MKKFSFCKNCSLIDKPIVHGQKGSRDDVVLIGEAPGRDEVEEGCPFVGRAGKLLGRILSDLGYNKKDFYISNSCICHPIDENGNNRKPSLSEISCCNDRLLRSIEKISPRVVISLGAVALFSLTDIEPLDKIVMSKYVGKVLDSKNGYKVFCMYHPAFILRNNNFEDIFKRHLGKVLSRL